MKILESYKKKILTVEKLKKIIGRTPRKKKVVLCHGVFDIVHPGHIRHLAHAKSKADILVVSVTADRFVKKGNYRPHVPEGLRAMNLAVLDFVDYVIIDFNLKPLKTINLIRPDYYAKGFEYSKVNKLPATKEELNLLKRIGSKMIFTPGDVIYSSSKILNNEQPNLKYEKLSNLITKNKTSIEDLIKLLDKIKNIKVHVIGDTIVDTFTYGSHIGGQTKTPTLSIRYLHDNSFVGGAAIVARHLRKAGASVTFTSLIGNDFFGSFVKSKLKKDKIKFNFIHESNRPTTNKNLIISSDHKLLKLDKVDNSPIIESSIQKIISFIKKVKTDIVIFSDFRHGIFNQSTIESFIKAVPKKNIKIADSQVASRWGNISEFKNFDLITPNEKEARFAMGSQDSAVGYLARAVLNNSKSKNIILKLSEKGVLGLDKNNNYFSLDSFCEDLKDAVGAGDALLAYSSLIYFQSKSLFKASLIGSLAAACECEKEGNFPIGIDEIKKRLTKINNIINFIG
jgi:rfaE bifunctional protein kinase chain/domain